MKFAFSDGEKIGVYEDGKAVSEDSAYIVRYRETILRDSKSKEWKTMGHTESLFSEGFYEGKDTSVTAAVHGVTISPDGEAVYAVTVNESSGIYKKDPSDPKKPEGHIVSSNDADFTSVAENADGELLVSVQDNVASSRIAVFEKGTGNYKCVTGGDSLDENPSFAADGKSILFNSYGIGRDASNNFVEYGPSEIYRLNPETMEIDLVLSAPGISYIKPVEDGKGNLYCIRKPGKVKTGSNPLVEIILVPVRVLQGIAGFISWFVRCFSGKNIVSGGERLNDSAGGAVKNAKPNAGKAFINNNLVNVDKEMKKNRKKEDSGFVPQSWKLVRVSRDAAPEKRGEDVVLASGVADFCLVEENGAPVLVYTNGKHIFSVREGEKRKKLLDTGYCLKVGAPFPAKEKGELYDFF